MEPESSFDEKSESGGIDNIIYFERSDLLLSSPLSVVSFSQTSDMACVSTRKKGFYVFDLMGQKKPLLKYSFPEVQWERVYMMNDTSVIMVNGLNSCCIYDVAKERESKQIRFHADDQSLSVLNDIDKISVGKQCQCVGVQMKSKIVTILNCESFLELGKYPTNGVHQLCNQIFAYGCPNEKGVLYIVNLKNDEKIKVEAHQTDVSCLGLNRKGDLLASASERGTLIRIFNTATGKKVHEVRRGTKYVQMHSICFSDDSCFLCCYSSSGTIHLFNLVDENENTYSSMYILSYVGIKFLSSQWSMQECVIGGGKGIVQFAQDQQGVIFLLTYSGKLAKVQFDLQRTKPPRVIQVFDINECLHAAGQKRLAENLQVISKFPDTIPIFLAIRKGSQLPLLTQRKYLVPNVMTVGEFSETIHGRLNLETEEIRLFVGDDMLPNDAPLSTIHEKYRDEDSFLYCNYDLP